MAYVNQEMKKKVADVLKPILARYGVKGTLSIRNHHVLVLTLKSGKIDFVANVNKTAHAEVTDGYIQVNPYWYQTHFSDDALAFLTDAFAALKSADWYDRSDARYDYFDTAYYINLNVGRWNKAYEVTT
jgi:MarR-like DNA-binding transcriptional regulator SgrR of sgrS sRNA